MKGPARWRLSRRLVWGFSLLAVIPLLVEETQAPGLLITNGEFVGSPGAEAVVKIAPSHKGVVQLSNSSFWGPHQKIIYADGTGTVNLSQCNFVQWDHLKRGHPAVEIRGGSLILQGSIFAQKKPHIRIGPQARSAVIQGNQFRGEPQIENHTKGEVQLLGNVRVP